MRDTLGVNRRAPDEFKVVSRPPLSIPPDFNLRPPEPGADPRATGSAEKQAESLVINNGNPDPFESLTKPDLSVNTALDPLVTKSLDEYTTTNSPAEAAFLSSVGAEQADRNIRNLLYQDNKQEPESRSDSSALETLLGNDKKTEPVVDPKAEAERIRDNKDEGKSVTDGEVKTIENKPASVIDQLFK